MYISDTYKQDVAVHNIQWLICHKTKPTQKESHTHTHTHTHKDLYIYIYIYIIICDFLSLFDFLNNLHSQRYPKNTLQLLRNKELMI